MRTRVYFNLHKKLLSVQAKVDKRWKVIAHVDQITLTDVKFKVSEAGRQRVLRTKRKNVHAFIEGTSSVVPLDIGRMTSINYNPYKLERFHDGEKYVDTADTVFIIGRRVFATKAS